MSARLSLRHSDADTHAAKPAALRAYKVPLALALLATFASSRVEAARKPQERLDELKRETETRLRRMAGRNPSWRGFLWAKRTGFRFSLAEHGDVELADGLVRRLQAAALAERAPLLAKERAALERLCGDVRRAALFTFTHWATPRRLRWDVNPRLVSRLWYAAERLATEAEAAGSAASWLVRGRLDSRVHQALDRLGRALEAAGYSKDGPVAQGTFERTVRHSPLHRFHILTDQLLRGLPAPVRENAAAVGRGGGTTTVIARPDEATAWAISAGHTNDPGQPAFFDRSGSRVRAEVGAPVVELPARDIVIYELPHLPEKLRDIKPARLSSEPIKPSQLVYSLSFNDVTDPSGLVQFAPWRSLMLSDKTAPPGTVPDAVAANRRLPTIELGIEAEAGRKVPGFMRADKEPLHTFYLPTVHGSSGKLLFDRETHRAAAVATHIDSAQGARIGSWRSRVQSMQEILVELEELLRTGKIERRFEDGLRALLLDAADKPGGG